jgi:hypothetical protein
MSESEEIVRLLSQTAYSAADCESCLKGQTPLAGNLGNPVVRLYLVSGIRRNAALARSIEITALCRTEGQEVFARARNARLIMSDEVPSRELMRDKASQPYCIWYPDVASEDTYRKLAAAFPDMRYQVGRACAVAGYAQLYSELDLLPDPSIAEEAREASRANEGSRKILEKIMAAPVRWAVMNDYDLTIELDNPRPGACLNADTAVRATLEGRKKLGDCVVPWRYFNITEDWGAALENVELKQPNLSDEEIALLTSPLPFDLPTMQKDLLILSAAYEGNLDRYARLRRPGRSVEYELHCLVPGVYRSTALALWLERHPEVIAVVAAGWNDEPAMLWRAIYARRIMNNDAARLLDADPPVPDEDLPYWIWYPTIPARATLRRLAEARPAMRPQCARACIAGGYRATYVEIMEMDAAGPHVPDTETYPERYPLPADPHLNKEAEMSVDHAFYTADLARRREERGIKPRRYGRDNWKSLVPWRDGDTSSSFLYPYLRDGASYVVHEGQDWGMWEELGAEMGRVRLYLSSPAGLRDRARREGRVIDIDNEPL